MFLLNVFSKLTVISKRPQNARAIFQIDKEQFQSCKTNKHEAEKFRRKLQTHFFIILLYFSALSFIYSLIFILYSFILFIYSCKVYFSVVKSAMEIQNIIIIITIMVIVVRTLYS